MYYARMQIKTNYSSSLFLVLLSCILLTIWQEVQPPSLPSLVISNTSMIAAESAPHSVWELLSREFQLNHQADKKQVQKEINKLLANQDRLYDILNAASPYLHFIFNTTKKYELPGELVLIPFIESEFNPNDRSTKGALGLWQLMPQTARELGVTVKKGYDGRRNLIASTHAALTYFNDLASTFKGNWYLAIAAYNAGPGRIISATKRTGTRDFWQLPLPKETKLYLPRLLAVATIIKNAKQYGIELPTVHNKPYFKTIHMDKPATLEKIAKHTESNLTTLKKLNPDLSNSRGVPTKNGSHAILIPLAK